MITRIGICPSCDSKYTVEGKPGEVLDVECKTCKNSNKVIFTDENLEELMVYPLDDKFEIIKKYNVTYIISNNEIPNISKEFISDISTVSLFDKTYYLYSLKI